MTSNIPLHFRERNAHDRNFIMACWMRSFRSNSRWAKLVDPDIYSRCHSQMLDRLLSDSGSVVACNPDDPHQIFGFAIYQPSLEGVAIIHWVYVKEVYRKLGIGNAIYREVLAAADHDLKLPVAVTHDARALEWAAEKYNLIYNPYLAFEVSDETGSDPLRELG